MIDVGVSASNLEEILSCLEQVGSVHRDRGGFKIFSNEPKKAVMRVTLILQALLEEGDWARIRAEFKDNDIGYLYEIAVTPHGYFGFRIKRNLESKEITPIHGGASLSELVDTCRVIEELVHYYLELKFVPWIREGLWFKWEDQWTMKIVDEDEEEIAKIQWDPSVIV